MIKINLFLWILGLALQLILLLAIFTRGLTRRVPVFAALICFYLMRSFAVRFLSIQVSRSSGILLFTGLGVIDVLLQTGVAWELFSARPEIDAQLIESAARPSLLRSLALFSILLGVAVAFAALVSTSIRANPHWPIDRAVLFSSITYLLVFLASLWRKSSPFVRRLTGSFAVYASASILCQIGRTTAALYANAGGYNLWSYAQAGCYLILISWIIGTIFLEKPQQSLMSIPQLN